MKLTDRQGFSLISAFLLGNVLSGIGGSGFTEKTGYLSVWLSFGIFVLFARVFQSIMKENPKDDFFTITRRCFGKIGNWIFLIFLAFYSFFAAFLSIVNYMDFINFSVKNGFPFAAGIVAVLLLTVFLCLKGTKTMGRYCEITLPIVIGSVLLLLFLGIREITGFSLPLPSSVMQFFTQSWNIFCSPFAEIIFVWILFDSFQNKENIGKISIKAGCLVTVLFTLIYIFNLNVLGENLLSETRFPTYFCASLVEIGILVENGESLITLAYSFCDILYGAVCVLVGVKAVCKLCNQTKISLGKTKKITAFSAVIFMFLLYISGIFPADLSVYYPVISVIFLPMTVGIPVLLFLLSKFKSKGQNQNSNSFSKKL